MVTLILGLNDKDTLKPKMSVRKAMKRLGRTLVQNELGYTLTSATGGYQMDNGKWVRENSIRIELFTDKTRARTLADQLKTEYNQESILLKVETQAEEEFV